MKSTKSAKVPADYPRSTRGSKIASQLREKSNHLSDGERAKLLNEGLAIIYGRDRKTAKAARPRH